MRLQGPGQALKRNFLGRPLIAGDVVATTGQPVPRRRHAAAALAQMLATRRPSRSPKSA
jgi:hypothetical protein